jgi:hypothetical protein
MGAVLCGPTRRFRSPSSQVLSESRAAELADSCRSVGRRESRAKRRTLLAELVLFLKLRRLLPQPVVRLELRTSGILGEKRLVAPCRQRPHRQEQSAARDRSRTPNEGTTTCCVLTSGSHRATNVGMTTHLSPPSRMATAGSVRSAVKTRPVRASEYSILACAGVPHVHASARPVASPAGWTCAAFGSTGHSSV